MMSDIRTISSVLNEVKLAIGEEAWKKLQTETQIGIITSELCYSSFKINTEFDFSSAIVPAMKGLELELRKIFYEPYLNYVVSNYTPKQYVQMNWAEHYPGDKKAAELRNKILLFDGVKLKFQQLSNEFTIGNFRFTVGASRLYKIHVDESFIEYCKNVLFRANHVRKIDIVKWIKNLVPEIEGLRKLRNDSTHAGTIQNELDAKTVLEKLFEVEKIMAKIVCPSFIS